MAVATLRHDHQVHWRVPATIVGFFFAGTALSVGHHCFYTSLHDSAVRNHAVNQQFIVASGTAFAFLVRASLTISLGATYWHVFWHTMQRRAVAVSTTDTLYGLLDVFHGLFSRTAFRTSPVLVLTALFSWLIPLAAVIPPASLSIRLTNSTSLEQHTLSVPDFGRRDAFSTVTETCGVVKDYKGCGSTYLGATPALLRSAVGTAYRGEVPPLPLPADNSSYTLTFYGPTVQCRPIAADILMPFAGILPGCEDGDDPQGHPALSKCGKNHTNSYHYISWTPAYSRLVPYDNLTSGGGVEGAVPINRWIGGYNGSPAEIFVATRSPIGSTPQDWNVLNCSLYNASYTSSFAFERRLQSITSDVEVLHPVGPNRTIQIIQDPFYSPWTPNGTVSYFGLMYALGKILAGTMWHDKGFADALAPSKWQTDLTLAIQTQLTDTKELSGLYDMVVRGGNVSITDTPDRDSSDMPDLATAIENLFQNMTLALFASSDFVRPGSEPTDVLVSTTYNTYFYTHWRLLSAYGIAWLLTLCGLVIGCKTILLDGKSFSNTFSTILRLTRGEELDELIVDAWRKGEDPLPRQLGETRLTIGIKDARDGRLGVVVEDYAESGQELNPAPSPKDHQAFLHETMIVSPTPNHSQSPSPSLRPSSRQSQVGTNAYAYVDIDADSLSEQTLLPNPR